MINALRRACGAAARNGWCGVSRARFPIKWWSSFCTNAEVEPPPPPPPEPPYSAINTNDYEQVLSYIQRVNRSQVIHYGIQNVVQLQSRMRLRATREQTPMMYSDDNFVTVHVTGTNGKGSVCTKIAHLLASMGLRVGLFTSPHLFHYMERIQTFPPPGVDQPWDTPLHFQHLTPEEVVRLAPPLLEESRVGPQEMPIASFFELTCLLGLGTFSQRQVDVAVMEVGLGGPLDATNVVHPHVSVLTSVGLDHRRLLGETVEEVCREKSGIARSLTPFVVAEGVDPANIPYPIDEIRDGVPYVVAVDGILRRAGHVAATESQSCDWTNQRTAVEVVHQLLHFPYEGRIHDDKREQLASLRNKVSAHYGAFSLLYRDLMGPEATLIGAPSGSVHETPSSSSEAVTQRMQRALGKLPLCRFEQWDVPVNRQDRADSSGRNATPVTTQLSVPGHAASTVTSLDRGNVRVVFDTAHNPSACAELRVMLEEQLESSDDVQVHVILAFSNGKDMEGCAREVGPVADSIWCVEGGGARSAALEEVVDRVCAELPESQLVCGSTGMKGMEGISVHACPRDEGGSEGTNIQNTCSTLFDYLATHADPSAKHVVVVTGSMYYLGDVRQWMGI